MKKPAIVDPALEYKKAYMKVKEVIMQMNGLTEEEFYQKHNHDVNFNHGFKLLVQVFLKANLDDGKNRI